MWKSRRYGGTSIAEEESNLLVWVAAAIGIAVIVVIVLMVGRGDEEASDSRGPEQVPVAVESGQDDPGTAPAGEPPPLALDPTVERTEIAGELDAELQSARMWSTLEVNDATILLRSANCGEDALKAAIAKFRAAMFRSGLTRLECYERHGSLIFEQSLAAPSSLPPAAASAPTEGEKP